MQTTPRVFGKHRVAKATTPRTLCGASEKDTPLDNVGTSAGCIQLVSTTALMCLLFAMRTRRASGQSNARKQSHTSHLPCQRCHVVTKTALPEFIPSAAFARLCTTPSALFTIPGHANPDGAARSHMIVSNKPQQWSMITQHCVQSAAPAMGNALSMRVPPHARQPSSRDSSELPIAGGAW